MNTFLLFIIAVLLSVTFIDSNAFIIILSILACAGVVWVLLLVFVASFT